jgi:enoyl-CoA hydratase
LTTQTTQTHDTDPVLVAKDGHVATVTINAAHKHNALCADISLGLQDAMESLHEDTSLRCVVIRGAGGKAFSAGADISEFPRWRENKSRARIYAQILGAGLESVQACRHPTIALIEGLCVGGGFGVAAMCDLRVCGESSRFGVPVKKLGLVESPLELRPLVRKLGANAMLEILLTGNLLDATDALRLGLVTRVVADSEVASTAYALANSIAEGAPLSARWHKQFIYRLLDPEPLSAAEEDEGYDCYDTEDFHRGYQAFLAKKKPEFLGR